MTLSDLEGQQFATILTPIYLITCINYDMRIHQSESICGV